MEDNMLQRLQDNLSIIRQLLGWSAAELARILDVSKQTISNIENHRSPITKMQYIAIRSVIEEEISRRPDDEKVYLSNAISLLLDEHDEISKEDKEKALNETKLLAAATAGGAAALAGATAASMTIGSASLLPVVGALGGMAGPVGIIAAGAASIWLPKVLGKDKKGDKKHGKEK